jgi:hypothetical protein
VTCSGKRHSSHGAIWRRAVSAVDPAGTRGEIPLRRRFAVTQRWPASSTMTPGHRGRAEVRAHACVECGPVRLCPPPVGSAKDDSEVGGIGSHDSTE